MHDTFGKSFASVTADKQARVRENGKKYLRRRENRKSCVIRMTRETGEIEAGRKRERTREKERERESRSDKEIRRSIP